MSQWSQDFIPKPLQKAEKPLMGESSSEHFFGCYLSPGKTNAFYCHTDYWPSLMQPHPSTLVTLNKGNFESSANFDLFPALFKTQKKQWSQCRPSGSSLGRLVRMVNQCFSLPVLILCCFLSHSSTFSFVPWSAKNINSPKEACHRISENPNKLRP